MEEVSRKRAKLDEQVPWSELPCLVLEKIYSFLSRKDQANMSLACLKWSKAFESPSLWKYFRFYMNDSMISKDNSSLTKFVGKYGRYFKYVSIYLKQTMGEENKLICIKHLATLLRILANASQLDSFWFVVDCSLLTISTYEIICIELKIFFGSQFHLKEVLLSNTFFQYEDGIKILKKCTENCKNSLKTIVLPNCFAFLLDKQESNIKKFLLALFGLPRLRFLIIDYWLIFGKEQAVLSDVIEKLSSFSKRANLRIWTNVDYLMQCKDFKLLTSSDWRHLKQLYPLLKISMSFGKYLETRKPPEFIIVEDIPIRLLEYVFTFRYANNSFSIEIDEFMNRLLACKINDCLCFLCLVWLKSIPDMASVFISFLKASRKLYYLELETVYPANHLDVFLDSLLKNRPESLKKFRLSIYDVEKEQVEPLRKLCSDYMQSLKATNLILEIKIVEESYLRITD